MNVKINDNSDTVIKAMTSQVAEALESCGLTAEKYAKTNLTSQKAVDTGNLRNSVTYKVVPSDKIMYVGTNVEYGVYIEEGTGIYNSGGRRTPWAFEDIKGDWHLTSGMKPRPFIKNSISDHIDTYKEIIGKYLKE